jgi:hypothetical protein
MSKYFIYRYPTEGYASNADYEEIEVTDEQLSVVLLTYDVEPCINGTTDMYFRVPAVEYDQFKKTSTFF